MGPRSGLTNRAVNCDAVKALEYPSHKVIVSGPFRCKSWTQHMSPLNREFFGKPEDNGSESSMTLFVENIPAGAVPSILDALQSHDINRPWVVHLRCSCQARPPTEFFPD
jgi:hypothetical protein